MASVTVRVALPSTGSLPAKSALSTELEASFLKTSQNCPRVGVFTQKLIFYANAYRIAVVYLLLCHVTLPRVCSGEHQAGYFVGRWFPELKEVDHPLLVDAHPRILGVLV